MKITLLALLVLIGSQALAQNHDENFRSGDPAKSVQVYPNPATDYLTLKFETPIAKTVKLEFHTIIGTTIELEREPIDEFEVRVKVKDLSTGYYIIGVHDTQSGSRAIHKFLKK
ncbi:MAG: T9SS type A sorting domain-containing protein [Bacteroidetes bacterium]|nr:T9SS type A sorting domain-containing protein [Bacteroidota bacterium]MBI3482209.1 T9SS type A sorting domain-containing protein [Bacteroidota bacterium]